MKGSDLSAYSTYRWIMNAPDLSAGRRRGVTFQERSGRTASTPRPRPKPRPSSSMPGLLLVVLASSAGILLLAVFGAYTLIREVFHS